MAKKKELTEEERGNLEAELRALHSSLALRRRASAIGK
jgi:hypothetical protein